MLSTAEVFALDQELQGQEPQDILARVQELIPRLAIAFSGAEDVLLVHYASRLKQRPAYITLDTGRLHPETLRYIETIRTHYALELEVLHPDAAELDTLIKNKGLYSFYVDGHEECCSIRKVAPLGKKLADFDAWVTGQRRDQSQSRRELPVLEIDTRFSTEQHQVLKINPLANWDSAQVWNTIRTLEIPSNPLHDQGLVSIGCEPCTRAIRPDQHEREGRWWWEETTIKECGLHRSNRDNEAD